MMKQRLCLFPPQRKYCSAETHNSVPSATFKWILIPEKKMDFDDGNDRLFGMDKYCRHGSHGDVASYENRSKTRE
jgi:hypothetical protein